MEFKFPNEVDRREPVLDKDSDIEASTKRLIELRAGRDSNDIPVTDEYWIALRKHQASFRSGNYK